MAECKKCVSEKVCRYNDGHNLYCKEDYECPNFKNKADVVEVVRCKDCKHRYVPTRCALWYGTADDTEYFVERGDDFYCSYGVAKMDGKGNCNE